MSQGHEIFFYKKTHHLHTGCLCTCLLFFHSLTLWSRKGKRKHNWPLAPFPSTCHRWSTGNLYTSERCAHSECHSSQGGTGSDNRSPYPAKHNIRLLLFNGNKWQLVLLSSKRYSVPSHPQPGVAKGPQEGKQLQVGLWGTELWISRTQRTGVIVQK